MFRTVIFEWIMVGVLCVLLVPVHPQRGTINQSAHEHRGTSADSRHVNVYAANLFHESLESLCCSYDLLLFYSGPLARSGPRLRNFPDEAPQYLSWWIGGDWGREPGVERGALPPHFLFGISLSPAAQDDTVTVCKINESKLYIQVTDLINGMTIDEPLVPSLAKRGQAEQPINGLTIRSLLQQVQQAIDRKEADQTNWQRLNEARPRAK